MSWFVIVNSYPANWSEEKAKKKSKKSCKNYHGVTDFADMVHDICTKSKSHKQWAQEQARTTALKHLCQVRCDGSSALAAPRLEAV